MTTPVSLGFRAQRGGAVVLGLAAADRGPHVVLNGFLATAAEGDRLAFEPYHLAYEMPRGADGRATAQAAAAVDEGRRRQAALAVENLGALIARLRADGFEPAVGALLVNRAGWMSDLLAHALSAPEHPPVIEGLAVREALRAAFARSALRTAELDEKSLPEKAPILLGLSAGETEAKLKDLGAAAGRPWRKEQKLAALAAWLVLASP
jgi:hypothetical protein